MPKSIKVTLFFIYILLASCGDNSREKQLDERELALAEKEKAFATRQQDYESLVKLRDSLLAIKKPDTITTHWPEAISGLWNSKLVCIASTCSEYVIGDQKTNEQWNFASDSIRPQVMILNSNKLIRTYTGTYDTSGIRLGFKTVAPPKRFVEMNVQIGMITDKTMKGTQTIIIDSTCNATFSVELSRIRNK